MRHRIEGATAAKPARKVRTTVRLPRPLYQDAERLVRRGLTEAETLNDFIIAAVAAYLKQWRRQQIDKAFAGMATDTTYQEEATRIAEEFSPSDWEALQLGEHEMLGSEGR